MNSPTRTLKHIRLYARAMRPDVNVGSWHYRCQIDKLTSVAVNTINTIWFMVYTSVTIRRGRRFNSDT